MPSRHAADDAAVAALLDPGPWRPARPPMVLVVDDEREAVVAIETALAARGYDVETAANGADAMEKAARLHPDVVVTDLLMPVVDGIGLAKALRAHPGTAATRIVLCSGVAEGSVRAIFDGYDAFLHKPYEVDDLERALAALRPSARRARP
jgi:CheY-like chemotaxis protein